MVFNHLPTGKIILILVVAAILREMLKTTAAFLKTFMVEAEQRVATTQGVVHTEDSNQRERMYVPKLLLTLKTRLMEQAAHSLYKCPNTISKGK